MVGFVPSVENSSKLDNEFQVALAFVRATLSFTMFAFYVIIIR